MAGDVAARSAETGVTGVAYHRPVTRLRFGAFVAPHPLGEHPMLLMRRDIELAAHLDRLGYDEFWCGEHHSSGWEMIASPEILLAAAAEHTSRIRLGTGVISLPYHHPFNVAQRIVQLDHQTGGRVIFGAGPGALASDAHTLGVDPMVLRDRQDEALTVILRLLRGEDRFTYESEWITLRDAQLQILPLQEDLPVAVASQVSPSGMTMAGKHGVGVLSLGANTSEGLQALPLQWSFAEEAAAKHGQVADRSQWRVVMSWHIAETREQARADARAGLMRWHNEYVVGTLGRPMATFGDPDEAVDTVTVADPETGAASTVIGTPDDLVAAIRGMLQTSGGFGTVIGFAHDWANREASLRSWDLVARYVVPEINGYLRNLRGSREFVAGNRAVFDRSREAILAKIMENERAAVAFETTLANQAASSSMPAIVPGRE